MNRDSIFPMSLEAILSSSAVSALRRNASSAAHVCKIWKARARVTRPAFDARSESLSSSDIISTSKAPLASYMMTEKRREKSSTGMSPENCSPVIVMTARLSSKDRKGGCAFALSHNRSARERSFSNDVRHARLISKAACLATLGSLNLFHSQKPRTIAPVTNRNSATASPLGTSEKHAQPNRASADCGVQFHIR